MKRRIRIRVSGRVQGVGFRPTVYRMAVARGLAGWVRNAPSGVVIEAEGEDAPLERFVADLRERPPRQARIDNLAVEDAPPAGGETFEILTSQRSGDLTVGLPPDLATCDACLAELTDPNDRRRRYPFINCTDCGPRFTVARELPYDRERTSMAGFRMCPACSREFGRPGDRRFEAQLDACPVCGPRLTLLDAAGAGLPGEPLREAVRLLREGRILAVKGVGGYHLCCDACRDAAVELLRERKSRPHKALAVMFRSLDHAREHCRIGPEEERLLVSAARPIVILKTIPESGLSCLLSPDTRDVGAFLPYTPLHHLLLAEVAPLVMTSGNRAEEPIARDEAELRRILGPIADHALAHDRPIVRRCDDSVVRVADGCPLFIRRSRGYVPDGISLRGESSGEGPAADSILACGADLKNTFCVSRGTLAFVSQHVGDLMDPRNEEFFHEAVADLCRLLGVTPALVARDLHPDYVSTRQAGRYPDARHVAVQHHHAHIAACMAEHGLDGSVIGVALDGFGMGDDGTFWGGEFLAAGRGAYRRVARFKPYRMPGGDAATEHPERMAYSCLLTELNGDEDRIARLLPGLGPDLRAALRRMVEGGARSPLTSSAGRLFDVVSAMLGVCGAITYEAQAAVRLEAAAEGVAAAAPYGWLMAGDTLDFGPALREIAEDIEAGRDRGAIAAGFHETVAAACARACETIRLRERLDRVALSGGCFQNARLLGGLTRELLGRGFRVYSHARLPPNDACISLGQVAIARELARED
ncbi:MAG: carbamoyltransferase HypF [Verrucomicrobiota bacterium]|nr:carbamoyltransferase HypF [Verrucomicrobiota bacterium]